MKARWLNHASVLIKSKGKNIYIDPYRLEGRLPKADLILITHAHHDHCSPDDIEKIANSKTKIIGHPKCRKKVKSVKPIEPGQETQVNDFRIKAYSTHNVGKRFHPEGSVNGYLIETEGNRIFHSGDTDFIKEFKKIGPIDLAFLPIGGHYTMGIEGALKTKYVIPIHYNTEGIEGIEADYSEFKRRAEQKGTEVHRKEISL